MVHFNICWLALSLSSWLSLLSGLLLALFSSLCLLLLLLFLLGDGWHWQVEDGGDLCLEGLDLVFNLFDGVWEVLCLGLLKS